MKRTIFILYLIFFIFYRTSYCQHTIKMVDKKITFVFPTDKTKENGGNKYIEIKINHTYNETNKEENIDVNKYKIMLIDENRIFDKGKLVYVNKESYEIKYFPNHSGGSYCNRTITPRISMTVEDNYNVLSIPLYLYCKDIKYPEYAWNLPGCRYPLKRYKYKLFIIYKDKGTAYYSDTVSFYVKRKIETKNLFFRIFNILNF